MRVRYNRHSITVDTPGGVTIFYQVIIKSMTLLTHTYTRCMYYWGVIKCGQFLCCVKNSKVLFTTGIFRSKNSLLHVSQRSTLESLGISFENYPYKVYHVPLFCMFTHTHTRTHTHTLQDYILLSTMTLHLSCFRQRKCTLFYSREGNGWCVPVSCPVSLAKISF